MKAVKGLVRTKGKIRTKGKSSMQPFSRLVYLKELPLNTSITSQAQPRDATRFFNR